MALTKAVKQDEKKGSRENEALNQILSALKCKINSVTCEALKCRNNSIFLLQIVFHLQLIENDVS